MTGEQLGGGLADMADAERVDEAVERDRAALVDGVEQLLDADLAETVDILELGERRGLLPLLQREDIGRRADLQRLVLALEEEIDLLGAETLDIEGVARNEVLQVLGRLRSADEAAGAAGDGIELAGLLVALPHRMRPANRTRFRKHIGLRSRRPLLHYHVEHLRDDVARPLNDDGIADADVVIILADALAGIADALDVILVVQRRIGDDDAADGHRRQPRHRRQRAGAADLDVDVFNGRERLLGRELVRCRPARAARAEAEALLQVETVDLVDDAVDIVVQIGTLKADLAVMAENVLDR